MARVIIQIVGVVGMQVSGPSPAGQYIKAYDPDAFDGYGNVDGTLDIDQAKVFPSAREAMAFIRQPSTIRPRRPDGQPNRPITAFSLQIVPLGD